MQEMHSLQYLKGADGEPVFVVLPIALWKAVESQIVPLLGKADTSAPMLSQSPQALRGFEELMQYWDFRYPYVPEVRCPSCGKTTLDWRHDADSPFILTNANIGGLLVFHCRACGSTIRQKYFPDHVAFEHTPVRS